MSDSGEGAITFPVLDDPKSLIGLLFGQNVTLVHVVAPELIASAGFSIDIPVWDLPPITVDIGGSIGIDLRFAAGYDTYGLVEAGQYIAGGGADPGTISTDLLDGLYIDDTPTKDSLGATEPATSVSILGSVSLSADVGIPGLLSAGVGGAVTLTVTMSLKDSAPQDLYTPAYYKANNNDNKTRPSDWWGGSRISAIRCARSISTARSASSFTCRRVSSASPRPRTWSTSPCSTSPSRRLLQFVRAAGQPGCQRGRHPLHRAALATARCLYRPRR